MISVIIPSYNSEKTIGNCIKALQAQSVKNYEVEEKSSGTARINQAFEIIVVDDGSIDKTADIVKSFKNVKFFKRTHKGPASARNFGAKMSRGDILLFTDSDCEPDKDWIAEMAEPFKDTSIVGVSGTYRTHQKEIAARFAQYEIEERHEKMAKAKYIDFIGTFSAGYRKDIFEKFGGFDESFSTSAGEDPELSFRIAEAGHRIISQDSKLFQTPPESEKPKAERKDFGASTAPKMVFAPKAIVYHTHPNTLTKYLRQKYRNAYWRVSVYAKRKKTFSKGHSYTPKSAMVEALTMPVLAVVLFFSMFVILFSIYSIPISLAAIWLSAYFSSYSLINYIFGRRDFILFILSPYIIFLRAFATALGIVKGLLKQVA